MLLNTRLDRSGQAADGGQALVMVMGMIIIMGGILTVIAGSTIFSAYFSSQSRASVESQAAADAGIDSLFADLANGVCPGSGSVDERSSVPAYQVSVEYQDSTTMAWHPGCPGSVEDTEAFKVNATGYAQREGIGGYDDGDVAEVTALWSRPETPPLFQEAIRGDTEVYFNSNTVVLAPTVDGDIYTEGNMTCASGMRIQGSVVATGNITWTGSNCRVDGDVYAGGDIVYPVGPYSSPSVLGDVTVLGNITRSYNGQAAGNFAYENSGQYMNTAGTVRAGGLIHAFCSYPGYSHNTNWTGYSGYVGFRCEDGTSSRVQIRVPGLTLPEPSPFVVFDKTSEPWASWEAKSWTDPAYIGNEKSGSNCRSRGNAGGHTIVNIDVNTKIDTTSQCGTVVLGNYGGITFNLSADLVIFGNEIIQNGNVTVNSVDGENHSIYFVVPAPSGFSSCPPASMAGSLDTLIRFSSGNWVQEEETAALFYTTEKLVVGRSDFEMGGQLYSCSNQMADGLELTFRRAGDQSQEIEFGDYEMQYVRQG